jgi:ankyrin repeat protein
MKFRQHKTYLPMLCVLAISIAVPIWLLYQDTRSEWLDKALLDAVSEHKTQAVTALLKLGANPNARYRNVSFWHLLRRSFLHQRPDPPGVTVLLLATETDGDSPAIVQTLLNAGADANLTDAYKERPLINAAQCGYVAVVKAMLAKRADVHAKDGVGHAAIHAACGSDSVETVRLLLDHGTDVNERSNYGETPLISTVRQDIFRSAASVAIVRLLLARGADVNAQDRGGSTALSCAVDGGNLACLKLLLKAHAAPNILPAQAWTPLMDAACANNLAAARLLLAYGADVNIVAYDGQTALKFANAQKHRSLIKLFKQAGARK